MIGVDTNVLIRYFLDDDAAQTERVRAFFEGCQRNGEPIFTSTIVLCETFWTLHKLYRTAAARLLGIIEELLDSDPFFLEHADQARQAVHLASTLPGDFPDYLPGLIAVAEGCRFTVTFDRSLHSHTAFREP